MAGAAAAITLGSAAYGAYEGHKANRQARKETNAAKAQADQANAEILAERDRLRQTKATASFAQRAALLRGAKGISDRGGSILTGPAGVTGTNTVLGA